MKREHLWPIGIVAVLSVTVLANVLLLRAASGPEAAATEVDYYQKAIAWDSTAAAERRSAATGWAAEARIERVGDRLEVRVQLLDAQGVSVEGAAVTIEAIHNLEAGHPSRMTLTPRAGEYRAALPSSRPGLWELRIAAIRGGTQFTADLRCEAPPRKAGA